MKSKHLLFTTLLFVLFSFSYAQNPEFVAAKVYNLKVSNGKLLLAAGSSKTNTQGWWISDGTPEGTKRLMDHWLDIDPYFTEFNNKTYFVAESADYYAELWVTDGTEAGTYLVKELKPAKTFNIILMTVLKNKMYFKGYDVEHGQELWVSDGTGSGTKLFKDIYPGVENGVSYTYEKVYNNKMYFTARGEQSNEEIWVSDGTDAGTKLFKDFNPEGSSSPYINSVFNGKLYFTTRTYKDNKQEVLLWVTDGTDAGTQVALGGKFSNARIVEFNGKGFFLNNGGTEILKLWSTDGTAEGTTMVEDSVGASISVFNDELYFSKISGGNKPYYDFALYKTKGKSGGGVLVKIISGGNSTDDPRDFVQANGKLYFLCNYDNSGANYLNNDLWETDGTTANTKLIAYSPGKLVDVNRLTGLTAYNNALYFADLGSNLYRIGSPNTAVTEIAHNNFEMVLFPNPATSQITIKTNEKLIETNYSVLNIMGQTMRSGKINSDNTLLEVEDLPGGSYFVRVLSKDGDKVSRFIKE
jgi:ELWxxDGT repeat protein